MGCLLPVITRGCTFLKAVFVSTCVKVKEFVRLCICAYERARTCVYAKSSISVNSVIFAYRKSYSLKIAGIT